MLYLSLILCNFACHKSKIIAMSKKQRQFSNFGEYLYWSYASFQMLFASFSKGLRKYDRTCYMIRAKFFKGYKEGRFNIRDLMVNNMAKLRDDNRHCWYCGCEVASPKELTIDHIFPRSKGGSNDTDNIFLVCKKCNSSKRDKDLLEWFTETFEDYPPLYLIAHYLKLVYFYAREHDLLEKHANELDEMDLPFNWRFIPQEYPQPEFFIDREYDLSDVKA